MYLKLIAWKKCRPPSEKKDCGLYNKVSNGRTLQMVIKTSSLKFVINKINAKCVEANPIQEI